VGFTVHVERERARERAREREREKNCVASGIGQGRPSRFIPPGKEREAFVYATTHDWVTLTVCSSMFASCSSSKFDLFMFFGILNRRHTQVLDFELTKP
jgi:hypothetical protein